MSGFIQGLARTHICNTAYALPDKNARSRANRDKPPCSSLQHEADDKDRWDQTTD